MAVSDVCSRGWRGMNWSADASVIVGGPAVFSPKCVTLDASVDGDCSNHFHTEHWGHPSSTK
jgi:hypothetical protein